MEAATEVGIGLKHLERDGRAVRMLHDAYLEALDRHDGAGNLLPEWEDVKPRERRAWRAVEGVVRLRVERAETLVELLRKERDALVAQVQALRSQVRFQEVLRTQEALETSRANVELEALRAARRRQATPPPSSPPLVDQVREAAAPVAPAVATPLRTVKVTAVGEDAEGGGWYLAVERGLHEVHQGATVRIQGSGATAEVTSVEPTAELPVFVGFPGEAFTPKAGDVLELVPKPGDEFPAFIA
ncbi:hypothetical protein D7X74_40540 [Corallococcus sp. CA047B]|uniref:hypothetical protein n=1 Tax=Corallococcus sp. CA047B TaxID=2316729 RepID=UPI000EA379AA|nr:hypothetical protein [Corallococcus sp. CA047B]RKG97952.1 hypothetical protein D7X74_40540 [Corallococcus sp. CA047B]